MARETLLILAFLATACGGSAEPAADEPVAAPAASNSAPAAGAQSLTETAANSMPTGFDTAAARGERPLLREVYGWNGTGRDPFRPLRATATGGPELPDLTLLSVIYQSSDPSRSVAVFKDVGNDKRYSVSPGDRIGRIRVASIGTGTATLSINDFGTTRTQTYALRQPMDVNQ